MEKIFVIVWKYSDGSGHGIVRAYEDKEEADVDLRMLVAHCVTKCFEIEETDLV